MRSLGFLTSKKDDFLIVEIADVEEALIVVIVLWTASFFSRGGVYLLYCKFSFLTLIPHSQVPKVKKMERRQLSFYLTN